MACINIPHIPPVNVLELIVCKEYEHGMYKHIPPVNVIELLVCKEYEHGMYKHSPYPPSQCYRITRL